MRDEYPQYVVRGGTGQAKAFRDGTRLGPNGFGFSVQTAPFVSEDVLAMAGSFPNRMISVSTVDLLEAIPGIAVIAPTRGFGRYHGTVKVPDPPPPGIFDLIEKAFTAKPNPYIFSR